jgi:hypothetical protein
MAILLKIIDEEGALIRAIGTIEDFELSAFIKQAKHHNMKCLSFVTIAGDTIFNEAQVHEIKKEVEELGKVDGINKKIIQLLREGIKAALEDVHQYLKFEGE